MATTASSFLAGSPGVQNHQQIFTQHKIGRHICVRTEFLPYAVIPSLVACLQAKSGVIKTLQTTVWSDECFLALSPSSTLTSVTARPTSVANLEMFACFTALKSCHLTSPAYQRQDRTVAELDMEPLQGLGQLTDLHLASGAYSNVAASQLTYLGLSDAEAHVKESCSFRSCLIKLTMVGSSLHNVDSMGLLSCTALQGLHIGGKCEITAKRDKDTLVMWRSLKLQTPAIPLIMSSLTALRVVELETSGRCSSSTFVGICKLPSINHLEILFVQTFVANSEFEELAQVTHLSMRSTDSCNCLWLRFDWLPLKALQCLHLDACFVADERMLRIAQLQRIEHVSLGNLYPLNETSRVLLPQLRVRRATQALHLSRVPNQTLIQ